mgnify:CR=1 FL=1
MKTLTLTVPDTISAPVRLDQFISKYAESLSRSQLKAREAIITVNGMPAKLSKKIKSGDSVQVVYSVLPDTRVRAEEVPLSIIFENENAVVIDKPQGMVVHPANGNYSGTLAQGLMFRYESITSDFPEDEERPGIVHRLDKDTSGVLIAAKNQASKEFLSAQFRNRETAKVYLAVVRGRVKNAEGIIDTYIRRDASNRKRYTAAESGGKHAVTRYRVLKRFTSSTFIALYPSTGRTHQLRVHMRYIGNPITGDPIYSVKDSRFPLLLHAYRLTITLPGESEPRTFHAPLPDRFKSFLREAAADGIRKE